MINSHSLKTIERYPLKIQSLQSVYHISFLEHDGKLPTNTTAVSFLISVIMYIVLIVFCVHASVRKRERESFTRVNISIPMGIHLQLDGRQTSPLDQTALKQFQLAYLLNLHCPLPKHLVWVLHLQSLSQTGSWKQESTKQSDK